MYLRIHMEVSHFSYDYQGGAWRDNNPSDENNKLNGILAGQQRTGLEDSRRIGNRVHSQLLKAPSPN